MSLFEIALSPCPNDTLLFYGWIKGKVGAIIPCAPTYADIETLNEWALAGKFPLTKLSFATLKCVAHLYTLLPIGSAIGFGVGPLIIAKEPISIEDLSHLRIAFPGKWTTATLLYDHFFPAPKQKRFCRYDEIYALLNAGAIDAGVIIHESRFTYEDYGFHLVADLGEMWEHSKGVGVPLGCLATRNDVDGETRSQLIATLEASLDYGKQHMQEALPFILNHAKETKAHIVQKHIELYVNEETRSLSKPSLLAIDTLLSL